MINFVIVSNTYSEYRNDKFFKFTFMSEKASVTYLIDRFFFCNTRIRNVTLTFITIGGSDISFRCCTCVSLIHIKYWLNIYVLPVFLFIAVVGSTDEKDVPAKS